MATSFEVPTPVKGFVKILDNFTYKHDLQRVFTDWLGMTLSQFGYSWKELHAESMAPYNDKEKSWMNEMFKEWIRTIGNEVDDNTWYDPLGDIYMALSSRSKQKGFGQFFTPDDLCNFIAKSTAPGDPEEMRGKKVLDPACGSGRMLLAMKIAQPYMSFYAVDKDPVCAKMCAINMAVHGCVGEVLCADALWPEWDSCTMYLINQHPIHRLMPVPTISLCQDVTRSVIYGNYEAMKARKEEEEKPAQLSLFD